MSQSFFFDNSSLANSFMQELFIGFNLNPNDGELFLKEARYDDLHNCFSIIISLDNGNDWIDVFTFESNYNNEIPPNPIKLEGQGIYKGVCCYAVVNWNAINDPSLADNYGVVQFNETIINEAAKNLDNSPTIKQFIYEHALDNLSGETVAHNVFVREDAVLPNTSETTISVSSFGELKNAINQNNVVINLTEDIVVDKDPDNNSLYNQTTYNNQFIESLIYLTNKNLVINGNGHKVYEKGKSLPQSNLNGNRFVMQYDENLEANDAFITSNGTIIPLTRSKMYQGMGWIVVGLENAENDDEIDVGIQLPEISSTNNNIELNHLYYYGECNNLFVSYRLSFLRFTKRVEYISNNYLFFKVKKKDYLANEAIRNISSEPDFFLINFTGDIDDVGALVKNGNVSYPSYYGNQIRRCQATYLFWLRENCNIVLNDINFIGGLDYAIRNDGVLHLNNCHFTNQVGGGVLNHFRVIVDRCYFNYIFSFGVRFDHLHGIYSQNPYMEVTNSTFRNIANYGTNTYAIRSTGKAYIGGNEFIDTNYGAIFVGHVNSASWDYLHSIHLIEHNYIHYTPEWIEKRKTFGLQDSGDIYVSVNNIMAVVRFNTIIGTGGLRDCITLRKNNAIYVDDGAYNVKVYGNVITGTENYYNIDSRNVSNDEYYNRLTPNNHDANNVVYNDNHTDSNNPDRAYIDLSKNNLIAFNVCDGWVRMQENLTLNETGCRFFNNFILGNFRSIQPDIKTNIYNRVDNCLHSEGITPDDYGMNSCASLWYLMYLNKKKSL